MTVSEPDAPRLQAVDCVDGAAVISGYCGFLAVQPQGRAKWIGTLLFTQLQKLAGFCPIQNQGKVRGWGRERVLRVRSGGVRRLRCFADLAVVCVNAPVDDNAYHHKDDHNESTQRCPPAAAGRGACRHIRDRHVPWLRRLCQLRHGHAEFPCQGDQIRHVRRRCVGLPLADGLAADAQPFSQGLLRDAQVFSIHTDALSQGHGRNTSFFCSQDTTDVGKWLPPGCQILVAAVKKEEKPIFRPSRGGEPLRRIFRENLVYPLCKAEKIR